MNFITGSLSRRQAAVVMVLQNRGRGNRELHQSREPKTDTKSANWREFKTSFAVIRVKDFWFPLSRSSRLIPSIPIPLPNIPLSFYFLNSSKGMNDREIICPDGFVP